MEPSKTTSLIYDGDCPICSSYVQLLRLRESVGPVELINARTLDAASLSCETAGIDVDKGMIFRVGGVRYWGADAMNLLALMSTRSDLFNRVNCWVFGSRLGAIVVYPVLRTARRALLMLMGRQSIARACRK